MSAGNFGQVHRIPAISSRLLAVACKGRGESCYIDFMNPTTQYDSRLRSPETPVTCGRIWEWILNLSAVMFNTGFAVLAIVTLCGIVFITKPKNVMHEIQPWMWLPLLIIMAPAQIYAQFLSWSTIFSRILPSGPAIAMRQRKIPHLLKTSVALIWLCNFCIGVGIVVSLSKPHPGNPAPPFAAVVLVMMIAFWLVFAANVYLLLAIRTLTLNEFVLHRVWKYRCWIDLTIILFGMIYYHL
jgi:hypothetical protein